MMGMDELLRAAVSVQAICLARGWKFCFIGGLALQRWGNPRFTTDIDLTLLTGFGQEEQFVDALLAELDRRRPDAREFALRYRVFLGRTRDGVDVDIALGALPFEERSIARATEWRLREHLALTTCSAEDLVAHKVFAARERDWADVETILMRQHQTLDLGLIRSELAPLLELKGETESLKRLEQMHETVARRLKAKV
jgi:hypothetical protein